MEIPERNQNSRNLVKFNPQSGRIDFAGTAFSGGILRFNFNEFAVSSDSLAWKSERGANRANYMGCFFIVRTNGNSFVIEVRNSATREVFLKDVEILFPAALDAADYLEYIHGLKVGSGSGVKKVGLETRWQTHNPESYLVYILKNIHNSDSFLVSTLPPHKGDYVSFTAWHAAPHLEGRFGLAIKSIQQRLIKKGAKAETSPIQFATSNNPFELLRSLGDRWASARKTRLKNRVIGWNSWDYYAGAVSAKDLYGNQASAKKHFGKQVKYFVIDEGYEPRWGVWDANWKFPEGLKTFCRKIKAKGGVPGVWTAPLLVNAYTDIYRAHPEWFARKSDGQIAQTLMAYGPMAYLDITRPEVEKFISSIYKRLKGYGFRYFKVDFTQEILKCDIFNDRTVPRGMILRKTFQVIRRAIGDECYLLTCGTPYESVTGIVDAVRVTDDIHNYWSHIIGNARSIAARWWTHRKLWNIDPDFHIVRCDETTDDKHLNRAWETRPFRYRDFWLSGRPMNYQEAKVYSLIIYLSAGDIFLGDNLAGLNAKGRELVRKVIEQPLAHAAVPVDMFAGHDQVPSIWVAEENDFWLVGLFNWEENARNFKINLAELGIRNYDRVTAIWNNSRPEKSGGLVTLTLPPRSCEAFKIMKSLKQHA